MKRPRIRKEMQEKIDEYIMFHKQFRQAENAMNKLRKEIEPYLAEKNIKEAPGTNGSRISIEPQPKAIITAKYTSYDLDDLVQVEDNFDALADCIVEVLDRDLVELHVKAGNLNPGVLKLKKYIATDAFTVKHI